MDSGAPSDTIAATLQFPVDERRICSKRPTTVERLNRIGDLLEIELEKLNVDRNIN